MKMPTLILVALYVVLFEKPSMINDKHLQGQPELILKNWKTWTLSSCDSLTFLLVFNKIFKYLCLSFPIF